MRQPGGQSPGSGDQCRPPRDWTNLERAWVLLVLGGALAVRAHGIGSFALADEEFIDLIFAGSGAAGLWTRLVHYVHPPAVFLLNGLIAGVAGQDADLWLRLPSLFAGAACAPVAYLTLRSSCGRSVAVTTALLLAFAPKLVEYSQLARPYSFACLAALIVTWAFLRLHRDEGIGQESGTGWVVYGLAVALGLAVSYSILMVLAGQVATVAVLWWSRGRPKWVGEWLKGSLLALGLSLPVLFLALIQVSSLSQVMAPAAPSGAFLARVGGLGANLLLAFPRSPVQWMIGVPLLTLAAGWIGNRCRPGARRGRPWPPSCRNAGTSAAITLLLPLTLSALAALLLFKHALYEARFYLVLLPAAVLLIALAIEGSTRSSLLRAGLLGVVLLPLVWSSFAVVSRGRDNHLPRSEILSWLNRNAPAGTLVVFHHGLYRYLLDRYGGGRYMVAAVMGGFDHRKGPSGINARVTTRDLSGLSDMVGSVDRLVLVLTPDSVKQWRDPGNLVEGWFRARYRVAQAADLGRPGFPLRVLDLRRAAGGSRHPTRGTP